MAFAHDPYFNSHPNPASLPRVSGLMGVGQSSLYPLPMFWTCKLLTLESIATGIRAFIHHSPRTYSVPALREFTHSRGAVRQTPLSIGMDRETESPLIYVKYVIAPGRNQVLSAPFLACITLTLVIVRSFYLFEGFWPRTNELPEGRTMAAFSSCLRVHRI